MTPGLAWRASFLGWALIAAALLIYGLTFVVALHVATAVALLVFYARDWVRIIGAFVETLRTRRIETSSQRLAWLVVAATVPVGVVGLAREGDGARAVGQGGNEIAVDAASVGRPDAKMDAPGRRFGADGQAPGGRAVVHDAAHRARGVSAVR